MVLEALTTLARVVEFGLPLAFLAGLLFLAAVHAREKLKGG